MNEPETLQVVPSGGALGAEIQGADLRFPLPPASVQHVQQALLAHGVVYFRRQQLDESHQVRFTSYFGTPREHVRDQPPRAVKEIFVVSNVERDGRPVGALGNGEIRFHSDLSYLGRPGTYSFLYAVEVPDEGGETEWCNCTAAYEALGAETQQRLAGLRAIHRHPIDAQNPSCPVDHPVVRRHPQTGRLSLYVSPHLTRCIAGMPEAESGRLLDGLFAHLEQPRFLWRHTWQPGDLLVWDNRPTMHRRRAFPGDQRRVMYRTQIFGEEVPVGVGDI